MKCEKCNEAEATVYYSVISGKFKATRKSYCRKCMEGEKVRLVAPQIQAPPQSQGPVSLMDVVQGELSKGVHTAHAGKKDAEANLSPDKKIKALERKMNAAIGDEKFEDAARIRDEIKVLSSKPNKDTPANPPKP